MILCCVAYVCGAVELKKQISTTMHLTNETGSPAAFKVKTTAPKKYCVRPNTGYVKAGETIDVQGKW